MSVVVEEEAANSTAKAVNDISNAAESADVSTIAATVVSGKAALNQVQDENTKRKFTDSVTT